MRLLADENFPFLAMKELQKQNFDIVWIGEFAPGVSDIEVLKIGEFQDRIILTFDRDFGELIYGKGTLFTRGIVLLRFIPEYPIESAEIIAHLLADTDIQLAGFFTVLERNNIRQRLLP